MSDPRENGDHLLSLFSIHTRSKMLSIMTIYLPIKWNN